MSDVMGAGAPMGAGPPMGGQQKPPMEQMRSPFNSDDAVMAAKRGQIRQGMTFGEYMQEMFGITPEMPMEQAAVLINEKRKTATAGGKAQELAGAGGPGGPPPGAMPPGPPPAPGGAPGGIAGILGQLGGR